MKKRHITLFTALAGLALTAPTWAATITWDAGGAADQKWSTAANWTGDALPGAGDTAEIAGGFSAVLDSSVAGITWLEVDGGATLTVKTGADLVMSGEFWVGRTSAATVLHEAGSITTGGGTNGGGDTYVNNGGKYTIEGGILTIGGDPQFGQVGAGGTLKIIGDAATINVNDDYKLWTGGSQDGALELVLKGGGISTINVTDYMQLRGTLDVSLDPSFVLPTTNTDYDLLVSAKPDRRGTFDTVTLPNETDWSLTYVDGEAGKDIVRLTYVPVPESSTLAITSFTLVGVDTYEVMLEGDALTAYKFDSSSTLVFPGTQVGSLQEGTIPVGTINVAEDEVTTTVDGLATVKMVLTGSANFVRAETAP